MRRLLPAQEGDAPFYGRFTRSDVISEFEVGNREIAARILDGRKQLPKRCLMRALLKNFSTL
jgi:hypothetical protein